MANMIRCEMLTQERFKEVLHYDPSTGRFIWLVSRGCRKISTIAGSLGGPRNKRVMSIKIDGKKYRTSRLAWFWMTGKWPHNEVDHKNVDRLDDRWDNLREATGAQNCANRRRFASKTVGSKGVFYRKDKPGKPLRRWRAIITAEGRRVNLGCFETHDEAARAYAVAASELHQEFARLA